MQCRATLNLRTTLYTGTTRGDSTVFTMTLDRNYHLVSGRFPSQFAGLPRFPTQESVGPHNVLGGGRGSNRILIAEPILPSPWKCGQSRSACRSGGTDLTRPHALSLRQHHVMITIRHCLEVENFQFQSENQFHYLNTLVFYVADVPVTCTF